MRQTQEGGSAMASALVYELVMKPLGWLGLRRARRRLRVGLSGRVLEVGTGTGLLLQETDGATPVVAVDIDLASLRYAKARAGATALVCGDVQRLPFREGTFDAAVASLTFCSVPDPSAGLAELRRVLKRGAKLRMLEHVRAPGAVLGGLMSFLNPVWSRLSGGCNLNRTFRALLPAAGFEERTCASSLRGAVEFFEAAAVNGPPRLSIGQPPERVDHRD